MLAQTKKMEHLSKNIINKLRSGITCLSLAGLINFFGCEDHSFKPLDADPGEKNNPQDFGTTISDNSSSSIDSEVSFNPSGEWIIETPFQIHAGSTYENGHDNLENPDCAGINLRGQLQNCEVYLTPKEFGDLGERKILIQEQLELKIRYDLNSDSITINFPNRFMYADQSLDFYSTNIKLQDKKGEVLLYVIGTQENEVSGCNVERKVVFSIDFSEEPTAAINHQVKFVNVEGQLFSCDYILNLIGMVLKQRPQNAAGTVLYPLAINGALNLPNLAAIDTLYYNLESRLIKN